MIRRLVACLGVLLLGNTGCFEDPPALETSVGSTTSSTDEGTSTTAVADDTAGQTVTISGRVAMFVEGTGYEPGTSVSLVGVPGVETTLDAQGRYVLSGVPVGQVAFLAIGPSSEYAGTVFGVDVGFADVVAPDAAQATRASIAMQQVALQSMDASYEYDPTLGHMAAFTPVAGVDVSLVPLPAGAVPFAVDALGNPILGQTASLFDPPLVAIANLPVEGEGYYQLTASHPTMTCIVAFPSPPTLADHITAIDIECS